MAWLLAILQSVKSFFRLGAGRPEDILRLHLGALVYVWLRAIKAHESAKSSSRKMLTVLYQFDNDFEKLADVKNVISRQGSVDAIGFA